MYKTDRASRIFNQVNTILDKLDPTDSRSVEWTMQAAKLLKQYDERKYLVEETTKTLADSRIKQISYSEEFLKLSNEAIALEKMLLTTLNDALGLLEEQKAKKEEANA